MMLHKIIHDNCNFNINTPFQRKYIYKKNIIRFNIYEHDMKINKIYAEEIKVLFI